MQNRKEEFGWQTLKEIWNNSGHGRNINIQMDRLLDELKAKTSKFEKEAIDSDLALLRTNWSQTKGMVSQFEKDAINKDLSAISRLLRRLFGIFSGNKR